MKNEEIAALYRQLTEDVALYAAMGAAPVARLTGILRAVAEALEKLKAALAAEGFSSQDEEIAFFKSEKPKFYAEHVFALEKFTIETQRPLNDSAAMYAYYQRELLFVGRFFEQYKFLYSYYQFGMKELDAQLFLRGARPDFPMLDSSNYDPVFTTAGDQLFGKFMAYERLREYLLEELESIESRLEVKNDPNGFVWTGDAINLAELAYGLWLTGQINNGNSSVTQLAAYLEKCFHVVIGKPHRRWEAIAARKRISLTSFLDKMRDAIRRRWDDENGR